MSMIPQARVGSPQNGPKVRQVWTPAEDQLLARAVQLETPKTGSISWCSVAAHLPGRNNKDCRKRWHYSIAHGHTIRKGTWTREEDQRLRDAVVIHGTRWSKIAQVVGTRNGDQCWKRWYDCLDPQIDKSPWTPEEDEKLLRMVTKHGRNWTGIVNKHFPKRTSLSAKNRYSILQRKQETGASSSRLSRHSYSHSRNLSTESAGSMSTTMTVTTNDGLYDMMMTGTESEYGQSSQQQLPQGIHPYWLASSASNDVPSGSSSPESTHADLVDWSAWGGLNNTTSDQSSSMSASYDLDTTSSYLSPSPTVLSMHSPLPDYTNMTGSGSGFYSPVTSYSTTTAPSASPSTVSHSAPVYTTTIVGDQNGYQVVPSYPAW